MTKQTTITAEINAETVEEAILAHEILTAGELDVTDPAQALAEANGLTQAADEDMIEAEADEAPAAAQDQSASYEDQLSAITDAEAQEMGTNLLAALAERAKFEQDANPNNNNIQKTISKLVKRLPTPNQIRGLMVTGAGVGVINKSEVKNKRRNVYALDKMQDLLYAAAGGEMGNAINRAILGSMVKLKDVGLPFTAAVAKAAASDKCAVANEYKPHLKRHTVAESTAPTQMSSTMTALEDLGAVVNKGSRQHPIFELAETPIARRLEEVVRTRILATVTS